MWALLGRGATWAASRFLPSLSRGTLGRIGLGLGAAEVTSRVTTDSGLFGHAAEGAGDAIERVGEEAAEAAENAEQHGFGQRMINWSNAIETLPVIGQTGLGQMIANFFRNWGEDIQDASTEHETEEEAPTAINLSREFASSALEGAAWGASAGMLVGPWGAAIGGAVGAGVGVVANEHTREAINDSFLGRAFHTATFGLFDGEEAPAAAPIRAPSVVPVAP
jgi:hypothetical protein